MTNRGCRGLQGGSSQPSPSTRDQQIGGAPKDDVIVTDDGLSLQPTPSSVGGMPSSLPFASMTTAPPVAPNGANMYPCLMFLPNGLYYRRPYFSDPLLHQRGLLMRQHSELWSDRKTFFLLRVGNELGDLMRDHFHRPFRPIPALKAYIWLVMLKLCSNYF